MSSKSWQISRHQSWTRTFMTSSPNSSEVVLTFDDGPWPHNTPAVLKALADECTTGIFFSIGKHATYHLHGLDFQIYGDAKTADNRKDAGALASSVMKNRTMMESRFNAARDELARQLSVNPQRIG
jgi:hypothetical protein